MVFLKHSSFDFSVKTSVVEEHYRLMLLVVAWGSSGLVALASIVVVASWVAKVFY